MGLRFEAKRWFRGPREDKPALIISLFELLRNHPNSRLKWVYRYLPDDAESWLLQPDLYIAVGEKGSLSLVELQKMVPE